MGYIKYLDEGHQNCMRKGAAYGKMADRTKSLRKRSLRKKILGAMKTLKKLLWIQVNRGIHTVCMPCSARNTLKGLKLAPWMVSELCTI